MFTRSTRNRSPRRTTEVEKASANMSARRPLLVVGAPTAPSTRCGPGHPTPPIAPEKPMTIVDTHTHVISPTPPATRPIPSVAAIDVVTGPPGRCRRSDPSTRRRRNHQGRRRAGLYGVRTRQPLPQRECARTSRPLRRGVLGRCDRPGCGGEDPALAGSRPTRVPTVHHRYHTAGPGRLAGPRKFLSHLGIREQHDIRSACR